MYLAPYFDVKVADPQRGNHDRTMPEEENVDSNL